MLSLLVVAAPSLTACTAEVAGTAMPGAGPTSQSGPTRTSDGEPDDVCQRLDLDAIQEVLDADNPSTDSSDEPAPYCVFEDQGGPGALVFVYDLSVDDLGNTIEKERENFILQMDQLVVDIQPDLGDTAYVSAGLNTNTAGELAGQASAGVEDGRTRWYLNLTASTFADQTAEQLAELAEGILGILLID